MNRLFWHSSDVFIQAHIETIYKLKKSLFRNKYTKTAFDAVSVAVVALRAYQQARCLCQVLCSY